jgi:RHS repeat-associated protein
MAYDHKGRRREKNDQRFFYDGYLQVSDNCSNTYIWDCTEPVATRPLAWCRDNFFGYYTHDGNKNVSEVVCTDDTIAAHYGYSPFGALMVSRGEEKNVDSSMSLHYSLLPIHCLNPWRFSSEYADVENGTTYYNCRHYNPFFGRWISRDFIHERGGVLLYSAMRNQPVGFVDALGLAPTYVFDAKNCILKVSMTWVITFEDDAQNRWTYEEKKKWKTDAETVVEDYFNKLSLKCYPQGKRCCKCKSGIGVQFDLKIASSGGIKVSVVHDSTHQSFTLGDRRSAKLDIGDVTSQDKGGHKQVPIVHEVGHMLGLSHPGGGNNSDDAYMRDPESLMGAGMDMRNADFKSAFCDHVTIQDSACSGWEVK